MSDAQAKAQVLMLKGMVSELPAEQQQQVQAAVTELKQVTEKHGEMGKIALVLIAGEFAAEA